MSSRASARDLVCGPRGRPRLTHTRSVADARDDIGVVTFQNTTYRSSNSRYSGTSVCAEEIAPGDVARHGEGLCSVDLPYISLARHRDHTGVGQVALRHGGASERDAHATVALAHVALHRCRVVA